MIEFGTLGEWVGAVFGTGLGIASLMVAWQANRQSQAADHRAAEAEKEMLRRQDEMDKRERQRDLLSVGACLQAWWATTKPEDGSKGDWGIIIANTGDTALLLSNVVVTYVSPMTRGMEKPARFKVLPPGFYFAESQFQGIGFPDPIQPYDRFSPVLCSEDHKITKLTYSTPNGCRWEWTPEEGLKEISGTLE